jgi:hypothetical protein
MMYRLFRAGYAAHMPTAMKTCPTFASIMVVAAISGHPSITDPLALWALAARVGQSTVHLISTRNRVVQLRFAFLLAQFVIQMIWIGQLSFIVFFDSLNFFRKLL